MRGTLRASIWLLATSATASCWAQFEAAPPTAPGSVTSGTSLRRDGGSPSAETTNPRLRSTAEQRAWLKGRLDAGIQNRSEVAKYSRQLDRFMQVRDNS